VTSRRFGVAILLAAGVVTALSADDAAGGQALTQGGAPRAAPQAVVIDSAKVAEAFSKGAMLFDEGQNYRVSASRREVPGEAELHEADADIVYVIDGSATLVLGGTLVGSKVSGPGEVRGSGITGGAAHELRKGDVFVVPAGVPHWFSRVSNPFLYLVVKAR
jgi:mannose-6-phosphate isomerase-like protein (cupin superfamily)